MAEVKTYMIRDLILYEVIKNKYEINTVMSGQLPGSLRS